MQLSIFAKREPQTRAVQDFVIETETQLNDPVLRRFDAAWRAVAGAGRLPSRTAIDPTAISDVLPHLMLVDVIRSDDDAVEFRSRFVGEHQIGIDGRVGAGEWLYRNPDESNELAEVVASGQPVFSRCRVEGGKDGAFSYDRASYPLSSDGIEVDGIATIMVPQGTGARRSKLHTFFSWF